MTEPVVIVDYAPSWPARFERLRERISAALGELAVAVEHVGSTAVPGLAAKPIIDLFAVVPSRAEVPSAIERLALIGYAHEGDLGIPGREAFATPPGTPPHDHHLYLSPAGGRELRRNLAFRDFLRRDLEAARAYAELKRASAMRFRDDRRAYSESKASFVEDALRRAGFAEGRS